MGIAVFPAPSAGGKTMFRTTLTSGTSYTVPAGVTYLNVTLVGGGGGGGGAGTSGFEAFYGLGGQVVSSTLSVTAGASITYAIGAGGTGGGSSTRGNVGGTTTFTGATSAAGGDRGMANGNSNAGSVGSIGINAGNGGGPGGTNNAAGGAGGTGAIYVEYWA